LIPTKIINLYAGPGAGKSTTAAMVFAALKSRGISCELVTEFAKDLTWDKAYNIRNDQVYVFGNQFHRIFRLLGQVEYIVVDSPLLLSIAYDPGHWGDSLKNLVMTCYNTMSNSNFYIHRLKQYQPTGRTQTKEQAVDKDTQIKQLLVNAEVDFITVPGSRDGASQIVNHMLRIKEDEVI
jgi:hypothetical protein